MAFIFILIFLTAGQSAAEDVVRTDRTYEMGESSAQISDLLFVEAKTVEKDRQDFVKKLRRTGENKRQLYEEYISIIGANGILDGIEELWPKCHAQAHDLGKVIFARVRDVGKSLRTCANRCYSGCMHGVVMEAFTTAPKLDTQHPDFAALGPLLNDLCYKNTELTSSHSPGDCAHGIGHGLMFLAGYNIPEATKACAEFDDSAMEYYCATGAYMEYVTKHDRKEAESKSLFYPCDTYDYPAACARYKVVHVTRRHYNTGKKTEELIQACNRLTGKFRLGCIHGLGNAHMPFIARDRVSIKEVCLHGTENEQFVCIEGAMERMAKFHEQRAVEVCKDLAGTNKETCLTAVKHKMYNMEKDFTLYLAE